MRLFVVLMLAVVLGVTPMPADSPHLANTLATANAGVSAPDQSTAADFVMVAQDLPRPDFESFALLPVAGEAPATRAASTWPARRSTVTRAPRVAQGPPDRT